MLEKIIKLIKKYLKEDESCLFIGSTDLLPPPLKRKEEDELAIKAQEGDKAARDKLIEHNLRLVVYLAKKYETSGYELEDLISIGSLGLIKGVKTYKVNKNIKISTYVSRCICNEILMFLRKNKRKKCEVSLEETLNYDAEGNTLNLEDVIGTDGDIVAKEYENNINKRFIEENLNSLKEREKLIMTLRYGLNNSKEYTQKEVADKLSISQSYISRIEKKVIKKLKTLLRFG